MSKVKTIGEAVSRIDGLLKVTGTANYAMDFPVEGAAYGFLVKSEIARWSPIIKAANVKIE